jgi:hypothetical protein
LSCEILVLGIELITILFAFDEIIGYFDEDTRLLIGWVVIGLSGAILLI